MLIRKIVSVSAPYTKKFIKYYSSCNELDKIVLGMVIVLIPSGIICAIIHFGLAAISIFASLYILLIYLFYPTGKGNG